MGGSHDGVRAANKSRRKQQKDSRDVSPCRYWSEAGGWSAQLRGQQGGAARLLRRYTGRWWHQAAAVCWSSSCRATTLLPMPQSHALVRPLPASVHSASITFCAWNASRPWEGREGGEGGQGRGQWIRCTVSLRTCCSDLPHGLFVLVLLPTETNPCSTAPEQPALPSCSPDVGSSVNRREGLERSSTPMLARLRSPPDTPLQAGQIKAGQIKGAAGGEVSGLGCASLHSGV